MTHHHPPASDICSIIWDFERAMAELGQDGSFSLYDLACATSARIAERDAFYICLYDEPNETLFFPYIMEDGNLSSSVAPLGRGPTSWVIQYREPFRLREETRHIHERGTRFGDKTRTSASALHLPMRANVLHGDTVLVGVLSVQSYRAGAFREEAQAALQWLADRVARALHLIHLDAHIHGLEEHLRALRSDHSRDVYAISEEYANMVRRIGDEVDRLRRHVSPTSPDLQQGLDSVLYTCRRAQTASGELPLRMPVRRTSTGVASADSPLARLTEREREILELLRCGDTNAQIARRLFISIDTVKFHCNNVYRKLNVSNRAQAIRHAWAFMETAHAPEPPGR